jgi:hypothetical protein
LFVFVCALQAVNKNAMATINIFFIIKMINYLKKLRKMNIFSFVAYKRLTFLTK